MYIIGIVTSVLYSYGINVTVNIVVEFVPGLLWAFVDVLHRTFPGSGTKISIFSPFVVDLAQFIITSFGSSVSCTFVLLLLRFCRRG